jgi:rubrerythrin
MNLLDAIADMDTFLAYAITLEEEAADRYFELADALDIHNNPEVAGALRTLGGFGREHADEIIALAAGRKLPNIAPWDFAWENAEGPETTSMDAVHYLMNTAHALDIALANELAAYDFYHRISQDTRDTEIKKLASEFAAEEKEHVALLRQWIEKCPDSTEDWRFDPDPANMPE